MSTRRPHRSAARRGRGGDRRRAVDARRSRSCASATSAARPSCRTCCAASPQLPPEERGAVGTAANQARQALEALIEARGAELAAAELDTRLAARPRRRHAARRRRRSRSAACTCSPQTRREIEDVFLGLGLHVVEGPEVELVHYNFDALNHDPTHPARDPHRHVLRRADDIVLRTHTSPMQVRAMEAQPPPLVRHRPRPRLPARHRRDAHAAVPPDRGPAPSTRTSRSPTSRARCWRSRARSSATSARSACARTSSRSPSRASRSTCRCFNCDGDGFLPDGSRCRAVQGRRAGSRSSAPAMVDPNVFAYVRDARLRPREGPGLRVRHGHRADRDAQARRPRPARCSTTTTCASWSSSADARARRLAARVRDARRSTARELAERLTMTGTEVERVHHHGVAALEHFVVGQVLERRAAPRRRPPAASARVDIGDGRAAADRLRRAERRRRPDGRGRAARRGHARRHEAQEGQAARRRVRRDDPRRGRARDRHRPRRDHGPRRPTGSRPGTPLAGRAADRDRRARARDHAEPARLPGRLRRRARGPRRDRRARSRPPPWADDPGTLGPTSTAPRSRVEAPDLCPRFTARVFEDVTIGPSPPWLKARLMAAGQRPISNVVDITNYVMLLDRPAAARVRPRPRRRRAGSSSAARSDGEQVDDARRPDPHASTPTMLVIDDADGPDVDRRRHGRRALRGPRRHDARADGGRQLGRPEHPPHLARSSACAARRAGASRRACRPSRRWRPRRSRRG